MSWYRWSRRGRAGSWHLTAGDTHDTLCGRKVPAADASDSVEGILNGDPPENEKTCETCLRVAHREDGQ